MSKWIQKEVSLKIFKSKLSIFFLVPVFAGLLISPTMAAPTAVIYAPGDPYQLVVNEEVGVHNIYFQDESGSHGNGGGGSHSYLLNIDQYEQQHGRMTTDPTCTSLDDPKCTDVTNFKWNSVLPLCVQANDINCLETFGEVKLDGSQVPATFKSNFPSKAQNAYVGDVARKLPSGGTTSVFSLTGPNGSVITYMVNAYLSGRYHRGDATTTVTGFNLDILPVVITPALNPGPCITNQTNAGFRGADCTESGFQKIYTSFSENKYFWGEGGGEGAECGTGTAQVTAIATFEKLCAQQIAFPVNQKLFVKLRLNATPTGWMHGRLTDPLITINKIDGGNKYSFVGSPVLVPILYKDNFWKDIPVNIQSHYNPINGNFDGAQCDGFTTGKILSQDEFENPLIRNFTEKPCASGATGITELNTWLPVFNNTATATPSVWNVRTISAQETQGANKCFNDPTQLTGIVTTNSTEYSSGPPTFSAATGTLDYQVASPHFMQDGTTLFRGVYNLVMRSTVARCLYSFSNAPVRATVSVIGASGDPEVATVIVGEKDGWLYLSANNFEFSSPTVQVKLSQDAPPAPVAPVATPTAPAQPVAPIIAQLKKITITCAKGKTTKKVSALKPVCPKGYVKK